MWKGKNIDLRYEKSFQHQIACDRVKFQHLHCNNRRKRKVKYKFRFKEGWNISLCALKLRLAGKIYKNLSRIKLFPSHVYRDLNVHSKTEIINFQAQKVPSALCVHSLIVKNPFIMRTNGRVPDLPQKISFSDFFYWALKVFTRPHHHF